MNPEGLLLLSIAFWLVALWLHMQPDEDHADARKRNPERTWDDEA